MTEKEFENIFKSKYQDHHKVSLLDSTWKVGKMQKPRQQLRPAAFCSVPGIVAIVRFFPLFSLRLKLGPCFFENPQSGYYFDHKHIKRCPNTNSMILEDHRSYYCRLFFWLVKKNSRKKKLKSQGKN